MTAQQCIRARRKAKLDPRYGAWKKDPTKRSLRMKRAVENEKMRQMRAKK